LIKKLDGLIVAQDDKGAVRFSGTDAASVIQSAINALTSGGKIFIKAGTYYFTDTIKPKSNISLRGEGRATVFKLANGVNKDMVQFDVGVSGVLMENLLLDGNRANNPTSGSGIVFSGASPETGFSTTLRSVRIIDCPQHGIYNYYGVGLSLLDVRIENCGGNGLRDEVGGDSVMDSGCSIGNCLWAGVYLSGSKRWMISNSRIWGNCRSPPSLSHQAQIYISGYQNKFVNISEEGTFGRFGFLLSDATRNAIINSVIAINGCVTYPTGRGISMIGSSRYNRIIGNDILDYRETPYQEKAVTEGDTSDYNKILFNEVTLNTLPPVITWVGAHTKVKGNIGYVTENSGTATFSGDGSTTTFTIAHGLAGSPKSWRVEAGSADAKGNKYVTADATNLTVTFATAPPSGTNNVVLVWQAEI
jgi:hypothetical protein